MTPEVFVSSSLSEAIKAGLAVGAGVGVKIVYDWLTANRKFMTVEDCIKAQRTCPEMVNIRKDFTEHKAIVKGQIAQLDKQMVEGHSNFKEIADNISLIKTNLAVISAWVEREHR